MNNPNALTEIQSKYQNCIMLIPAATSVQINPFYKCTVMTVEADTSPNSGDIFSVGKVKTGEDYQGKAIYSDVYSLAKPLLMKLATAAGIQFHPVHTTVIKENDNTYVGRAYGALRLPDGTFKTQPDTKRICLDDEEAKYRLEFMDKSIKGITDWKAAKAAEEMFKGHWEDTDEMRTYNGREYPVKKFVIDDCDREKYIARSVLVNMTLLRKTASEKAQTGAILRVIRALLGIKGTYQLNELKKPFAVPTVTFSPDYTDANVRNAMLQQGMNSMGNLFGTAYVPTAAIPFENEVFSDSFDPENNLDNPAFYSESSDNEEDCEDIQQSVSDAGQGGNISDEMQNPVSDGADGNLIADDLCCDQCGTPIKENVYEYSINKFGRSLCIKCQRGGQR